MKPKTSPKPTDQITSMIYIGATKEAISSARDAILQVIAATDKEAVACAALKTLRVLCHVNNVSVTNCTFTTGGTTGGKQ